MLRLTTLARATGSYLRAHTVNTVNTVNTVAAYWLLGGAAPALALAAYFLILVLKLPQFYLAFVAWDGDATTFMLLSKTIAQGMPGTVYTGFSPHYTTILINVLTYHLPDYQFVWMAWPLAGYVAAVGVLALTVSRLAGRWAALMTGILCLAPTPSVLRPLLAQAYHGVTVINCILLAVFLVVLVEHGTRTTPAILLTAAGLGIFSGLNAASDFLVVVIGLIPITSVALVHLASYRDRSSVRVGSISVGIFVTAIVAETVTSAIGKALSVVHQPFPVGLIPPNELLAHLELAGGIIWEEVAAPWQYVTREVGYPEFLLAIATLGAIVTAAALLSMRLFGSRRVAAPPRMRALEAHYLSWTALAAANFAAISLTYTAYDLWAVRYAVILGVAGAATVPLLFTLSRVRRVGFALVVTALVAIHACALSAAPARTDPSMTAAVAYLESQHIRYGYADYLEANATTWVTQGVLTLRPAISCSHARLLCRTTLGNTSSWYAPQPGWSAVIIDPRHPLSVPPASIYGLPREIHRIGQLTIYVYDHDLGPVPLASSAEVTQVM